MTIPNNPVVGETLQIPGLRQDVHGIAPRLRYTQEIPNARV